MSDSQKLLEIAGEEGKNGEDNKVKKLKFTPPLLHEYGEIVKICQASTIEGNNDTFTS
jgi:hypothetical protein